MKDSQSRSQDLQLFLPLKLCTSTRWTGTWSGWGCSLPCWSPSRGRSCSWLCTTLFQTETDYAISFTWSQIRIVQSVGFFTTMFICSVNVSWWGRLGSGYDSVFWVCFPMIMETLETLNACTWCLTVIWWTMKRFGCWAFGLNLFGIL